MLQRYGNGTNIKCKECGRPIFFTEADVATRNGERLIAVKCVDAACPDYNRTHEYSEGSAEIVGAVG